MNDSSQTLLFKYRNHSVKISSPIYNDLSISLNYFVSSKQKEGQSGHYQIYDPLRNY